MLNYQKYQSKSTLEGANGKWFIRVKANDTLDLAAMAQHMAEHNCGFSEAQIYGVLKALIACVKEQLLNGKKVKLDDLAIFYLSCHCKPSDTANEATPDKIRSLQMKVRSTGRLSSTQIAQAVKMKEQEKYSIE